MLGLANVLLGAALGVRCNVLALGLATMASVALSIGLGLIAGDGRLSILVSAQLNVIGLQVGYLACGLALSIMFRRPMSARRLGAAQDSGDAPAS
jgi:hypothetical protein